MPNQAQHALEYRTYFNGYRLVYTGLHSQTWEYDAQSNLRRIYFPSQRLITYNYDENNRLIYAFADGCKTSVIHAHAEKIIRMEYPRGQLHEQIYTYDNSSLLNHFLDFYNDKTSFFVVAIRYSSVHSFHVRLLSSKNFDRHVHENYPSHFQSNYSLTFDPNSGYLQSNAFVRFTYPTIYECYIKDASNSLTLSKRIDEYKRLKEVHLNYKNQKRLTVELVYNNKQLLLEQIKISLNDLDRYVYSYEYDHLKRLISIRKNDQLLDAYQYDLNNNLNSTTSHKTVVYNQWNQILQTSTDGNGSVTYEYDPNGFLHLTSANKLYLFNSFGLLIKYKCDPLIIEYIYDSEQRLITKSYPLTGHYVQFIYGNIIERKTITHLYHSQSKSLTTIYYDNNHQLIGFEQNQRKFFVVTDSVGSPLFVYDQQGLLVQEKFYGLYGMALVEKNYQDKVFFPFGYAGLLMDDDLKCAFEKLTGKLFDVALGRYLVPNFPLSWTRKQTDLPTIENPLQNMNLYQIDNSIYHFNDVFFQRLHHNGRTMHPSIPSHAISFYLDILNQLQNLNYDLSNLFHSISTSPYFNDESHLLEENPFIYTTFFAYFNEHYSIVYPNQFSYSIAQTHNDNDFWLNRTLTRRNGDRRVEFHSFASSDDAALATLFNQSYLLPYRQENEFYFVQNLSNYQQLKSHFNQPLFRQFKINVRYQTKSKTSQETPVDMDFIINNLTVFHLKFAASYDEEHRRLLDSNLAQMTTSVWQRERTYLMDNARLYHLYTWSQNEIDELITNGYLTNYTVAYRYDPFAYPDIADDLSNVMFKMKQP